MAETNSPLIPPPSVDPPRKTGSIVPLWVNTALVSLLLIVIFGPLLVPVEAAWRNDPNYSHGYLVPFICVFLGIRAWNRAGQPGEGAPGFAFLSLVPGCLLLIAATLIPWPLIIFGSLALIVRGTAIAVGGRAWAKHFSAPILFAFFMFPVPFVWTSYMALWLQDVVSRTSAAFIEPFVICYRTGTILHLVGVAQPLNVGEACSGLRQLVGFLAFAVLLGMLLERPAWLRVLLLVLAIPFAVLANVFRVLLMCFGALNFGTDWMNGWLHHAPAAFTIPVGFAMLIVVDYLLGTKSPISSNATVDLAPKGLHQDVLCRRLRPLIVFLALALGMQLTLKTHLRSSGTESFPTLSAPLADLPTQITDSWLGHDLPELADLRSKLPYPADDILLRTYRWGANGPAVQLYAVYSRVGDDRKHHPEICIREVSGAPEDLAARKKVDLADDPNRKVQRFVFRTGTLGETTVYYWHYTLLAPAGGNSFFQTLHQQLGQNAPSLTVQVSTNTADAGTAKLIENSFLPALDAALSERFLPATARIDSTRLPVALLRE